MHSLGAAESYIRNNIWAAYRTHSFGLYVVRLNSGGLPLGLCGLVKRDFLSAPDLGFALLPDYVGHGYATEASRAVMQHAKSALGIERLYAIVKRDNQRSVRLLERLGFGREGPYLIQQGDEVDLYVTA